MAERHTTHPDTAGRHEQSGADGRQQPVAHHESHGHSPAAWTGVIIILVSALLVSVGMVLDLQPVWIAGAAGVVIGLVAWVGMTKAGYGENGTRRRS